ncbi:MAG: hypothetical protein JNL97_10960 [Verrucomicrobiales bacterium]|nr:hypothetical protein [Verrucomicrobiales bacterium]
MIDADVIIRGERGTFDLPAWVAGQLEDEFAVAAITVMPKRPGSSHPFNDTGG